MKSHCKWNWIYKAARNHIIKIFSTIFIYKFALSKLYRYETNTYGTAQTMTIFNHNLTHRAMINILSFDSYHRSDNYNNKFQTYET